MSIFSTYLKQFNQKSTAFRLYFSQDCTLSVYNTSLVIKVNKTFILAKICKLFYFDLEVITVLNDLKK